MKNIFEFMGRANYQVFTIDNIDKTIIVYDDHRCLLNVLFELSRLGIVNQPNLIYFDYHDDAVNIDNRFPGILKRVSILQELGVENLNKCETRRWWDYVEFIAGGNDDTWLPIAMELNLIKNAVLVGGKEIDNYLSMMNSSPFIYKDSCGNDHNYYAVDNNFRVIDHPKANSNDKKHPHIWEMIGFDHKEQPYNIKDRFILDFDLDCFSHDQRFAWSVKEFEDYLRHKLHGCATNGSVMCNLIRQAEIITICMEPEFCGGIGNATMILSYLDNYFFNGELGTKVIFPPSDTSSTT